MTRQNKLTRRQSMQVVASSLLAGHTSVSFAETPSSPQKVKKVAGIVTAYQTGLHADVLLGKILEGWRQDGGPGPALQLSAMYVDQFPNGDLARPMAEKHNVPIFDSIEEAITLGSNSVAVDGVISIGEHGNYPWNDKEQHLYPRRRFFKGITDTFEKYGRVVPVFNDKHLGPEWTDAKWMYDRAQQLEVPFMAGSSLPVTFRAPEIAVPPGSEIQAALGVGYSGLDIYGSHTLECFQSLVERRRGGETGVASVQCVEGSDIWPIIDRQANSTSLLKAALEVTPHDPQRPVQDAKNATLFLFEYEDGFQGNVLMLPGYAQGISAAVKLRDQAAPLATRFEERREPKHPHFAYLLKAIERFFHTGTAPYPVERTLLTSGILDRILTSRHQGYPRLQTPELAIAYRPADYPFAPNPPLKSDPTAPL